MATDDSCRDLYSKQMSTVMTLKHSDHHQSCLFPNEFQYYEWYSINRTIQMIIKNNNIELIGLNKRFNCYKIISSDKSMSIYRIRTFTNWYEFHFK